MGEISTTNRPRKSTMSKIGRVFGLSSQNLVHEASHDGSKSPNSVQPSAHDSNPVKFYDLYSHKASNTDMSSAQSTSPNGSSYSFKDNPSEKKSPSMKESAHSPLNSPSLAPLPGPTPSRQSSMRKPHAASTAAPTDTKKSGRASPPNDHEKVSLSRSASTVGASGKQASSTNLQRFMMLENGSHEHHLRNAKRQEKLGHMIKDLLGAKKLRDEAVSAVPNILSSVIPAISENPSQDSVVAASQEHGAVPPSNAPPTLFAGLINQVKRGEITQYSGGPMTNQPVISATSTIRVDSRSFVEKYGRCQEVIGRGAFGVVRVSHKKDGTGEVLYAVKEFKRRPQESEKKYSRRLTSEFCISSSLQHVNIIHTLDLLQDAKGDYCEVMEFCSGGDLYSLIITSGKLEYIEADCFFKQLMRGVNYMHEMGVAHRDLKPENLLLTAKGTLKITDFGNGELFRTAWETDIHLSGGICGSSPYIAPEEYTADEFDPRKVDIWSCGVIYMAMRTGRQLWKLANADDEFYATYLEKRKDAKGYEPIENLKRARCRNVIYSILDPVPNRRITSKQILNSEWCREIKLCAAAEGKVTTQ